MFDVVRPKESIEDPSQPPQQQRHPLLCRPFVHFRSLVPGFAHDVNKASCHSNEMAEVVPEQSLREACHRFTCPSAGSSIHGNIEDDRKKGFVIPEVGVAP